MPRAKPSVVRYWLWTLWSVAFLAGAIAFLVQGVLQGWTLAALTLIGVAILVFAASAIVHVRILIHLHGQHASSDDGAQA